MIFTKLYKSLISKIYAEPEPSIDRNYVIGNRKEGLGKYIMSKKNFKNATCFELEEPTGDLSSEDLANSDSDITQKLT